MQHLAVVGGVGRRDVFAQASRTDVQQEPDDIPAMRARASWEDTNRMSTDTRASYHNRNRKVGCS